VGGRACHPGRSRGELPASSRIGGEMGDAAELPLGAGIGALVGAAGGSLPRKVIRGASRSRTWLPIRDVCRGTRSHLAYLPTANKARPRWRSERAQNGQDQNPEPPAAGRLHYGTSTTGVAPLPLFGCPLPNLDLIEARTTAVAHVGRPLGAVPVPLFVPAHWIGEPAVTWGPLDVGR
jgi:hypothetical protein